MDKAQQRVLVIDDEPDIRPYQNVYAASRAPWYVEPNSLPEYDELPKKG